MRFVDKLWSADSWVNKLWCWSGWVIIKWPFGIFVLFFVTWLIWNMETVRNYDDLIVKNIKDTLNYWSVFLKELTK